MASEKEQFGLTGPSFLTTIDWNNSHHKRSITASLVQGVYVLEHDRRQNRLGPQALAPPWWEFFGFRMVKPLIDDRDASYFGAIYTFNVSYPYPGQTGPQGPQYVIAFRGSINKSGNWAEDLKLNLNCMINALQDSRRFHIGMESVRDIVSRDGPGAVWLAGHALGSSLALLIGRHMATTMSAHLESYFFNPPFASPPIERIKNEKLKLGLRFANSVLTASLASLATLAAATGGGHGSRGPQNDSFSKLLSWIPYLFVNPGDMICCEYIGYFEHRDKMESIGAGMIGRLATKHSIGSIVASAKGKDYEAVHLIPSASLTINPSPSTNLKEAHEIHQWWRQDLELKNKLYQYK